MWNDICLKHGPSKSIGLFIWKIFKKINNYFLYVNKVLIINNLELEKEDVKMYDR